MRATFRRGGHRPAPPAWTGRTRASRPDTPRTSPAPGRLPARTSAPPGQRDRAWSTSTWTSRSSALSSAWSRAREIRVVGESVAVVNAADDVAAALESASEEHAAAPTATKRAPPRLATAAQRMAVASHGRDLGMPPPIDSPASGESYDGGNGPGRGYQGAVASNLPSARASGRAKDLRTSGWMGGTGCTAGSPSSPNHGGLTRRYTSPVRRTTCLRAPDHHRRSPAR